MQTSRGRGAGTSGLTERPSRKGYALRQCRRTATAARPALPPRSAPPAAAGRRHRDQFGDHDPTADQDLFVVLRGHAVFELDGTQVDAPAGTLVFAPPHTTRTAVAREAGTTVLLVEGTPGRAYEPRAGSSGRRSLPTTRRGSTRRWPTGCGRSSPPRRSTRYCSSTSPVARASPAGRATLDHLRQALEMSDEFRASARTDSDLDPIRHEPDFEELVRD